jgi:hypothetical protein
MHAALRAVASYLEPALRGPVYQVCRRAQVRSQILVFLHELQNLRRGAVAVPIAALLNASKQHAGAGGGGGALADELVHLLVLPELAHVGAHDDERAVVFDGHARAVDGLSGVRCIHSSALIVTPCCPATCSGTRAGRGTLPPYPATQHVTSSGNSQRGGTQTRTSWSSSVILT